MSESDVKDYTTFTLPSTIVSKVDLARLVREFEKVDNELTAKTVREKAGAEGQDMTPMSPTLADFLEANPVNLEDTSARTGYIKQLRKLKDHAPEMNMTFAVVADPESLQQLSAWVRESVHPQTLIKAHLQPALVAGMYLRTPNHVFDMSVRNALKAKRADLEKELGAPRG